MGLIYDTPSSDEPIRNPPGPRLIAESAEVESMLRRQVAELLAKQDNDARDAYQQEVALDTPGSVSFEAQSVDGLRWIVVPEDNVKVLRILGVKVRRVETYGPM